MQLIGLKENLDGDILLENNHIQLWDHAIIAINNVPQLLLWKSEQPRRPLYLPTDNSSIVTISHWTRDIDLKNMWNLQDFTLVNEMVTHDLDLLQGERGNEITNIIYDIKNPELINNKYISDDNNKFKLPESAKGDTLETYYAELNNCVNYIGGYDLCQS